MNHLEFSESLLVWYSQHARDLPWRNHPEPYTVWVSEIMLQQTRVETVIPYFNRWMARFPSLNDLASASLQDVLAAWEGLGYYGRARNLHRASKIVVNEYNSILPKDIASLRRLPGIGRYTAGAIASLAFGLDVAALDGNGLRVFARVFNVTVPPLSPSGEKQLWELASAHLPSGRAGEFNQALMDLGATVCIPRLPDCKHCPLNRFCLAFANGLQEKRPVNAPRIKIPHYIVTAAVIGRNRQVLISQRPINGLLGGLWEFPGGKLESNETLANCLIREIKEELDADIEVGEKLGEYRHAYTHFKVTAHAFLCSLHGSSNPLPIQARNLRWVACCELASFPMGKIDRLISRDLQAREGIC